MAPLTADDVALLDLEGRWWRYPGAKEEAIRALGLQPTRYYQRLVAIINHPDAVRLRPLTVRRLQRLRAARARRTAGRYGSVRIDADRGEST